MLRDNSALHPDSEDIIDQLRKENESAEYALDSDGGLRNDAKWYNCEAEMREFSKKFPDALFVMHGDGEGGEDFWNAYFLNGKSQFDQCRLVYDGYEESRLS
jgi:hypothetical protein